jgi:hypothetical protein
MTEHRAAPIPTDPEDKYGWHRRFTWNVQVELARKQGQDPITPEAAGVLAKEKTRTEYLQANPSQQKPEWLP